MGKGSKKRAGPYPETLRSDYRLNPLESLADNRITESLWSIEVKPEKLHVLSSPKSRDFGGAFAAEMDLLTRVSFLHIESLVATVVGFGSSVPLDSFLILCGPISF